MPARSVRNLSVIVALGGEGRVKDVFDGDHVVFQREGLGVISRFQQRTSEN